MSAPAAFEAAGVRVLSAAPPDIDQRPRPALPALPLWTHDLGSAPAEDLVAAAVAAQEKPSAADPTRLARSVRRVLAWLETAPGDTWTERWHLLGGARGWDAQRPAKRENESRRSEWGIGVRGLIGLGALRPDWGWYLRERPSGNDPSVMRQDQAAWDAVAQACSRRGLDRPAVARVERVLSAMSLVHGTRLAGLRAEDFAEYAAFRSRSASAPGDDAGRLRRRTNWASPGLCYQVLWDAGVLPKDAPPVLAAALGTRRTVRDLVDAQQIRTPWFRDLLTAYAEDVRTCGGDFSSSKALVQVLGGVFWRSVEKVVPDPSGLALTPEQAGAVKAHMRLNHDGSERLNYLPVLFTTRAFYRAIRDRSHDDPRYAPFVARCPVLDAELDGWGKHTESRKAVQDQRTRDLTPLLPGFRRFVAGRAVRLASFREAAERAASAGPFEFEGRVYTAEMLRGGIRTTGADGARLALGRAEEKAFWTWAALEVLVAIGPRIEEVTELTERSVTLYEGSNGKIPLLHIAPSKTNRERLIPVNQDLLTVLKQMLRRHRTAHGHVPVLVRRDPHEEVWSPPLPFLFQVRNGGQHRALSASWIRRALVAAMAEYAESRGLSSRPADLPGFTPHDLRRMWATRAVNTGLPVHIAAAILGHRNLETTRGYIATWTEESNAAYLAWIQHLRDQRPAEEYREATPRDLHDADAYLNGRQVQGGRCTRAYKTDCTVGHNCARCPLVALGPDARDALARQQADAQERLARAEAAGWEAEAEGHRLDLLAIRGKQADLDVRDAALALPPAPDLDQAAPSD